MIIIAKLVFFFLMKWPKIFLAGVATFCREIKWVARATTGDLEKHSTKIRYHFSFVQLSCVTMNRVALRRILMDDP